MAPGAEGAQDSINSSGDGQIYLTIILLASNILLGASLNSVLGMINAMQIVIMMPLTRASVPANAGEVLRRCAKVAAFDFLDIGEFVNQFLDIPPTDPVDEKYETLGFESLYFINNVGTFITVMLVYMIMITFWILMFPISWLSSWVNAQRIKLGDKIFWAKLYLVILESFMIVFLCCMIAFKYNFEYGTVG